MYISEYQKRENAMQTSYMVRWTGTRCWWWTITYVLYCILNNFFFKIHSFVYGIILITRPENKWIFLIEPLTISIRWNFYFVSKFWKNVKRKINRMSPSQYNETKIYFFSFFASLFRFVWLYIHVSVQMKMW